MPALNRDTQQFLTRGAPAGLPWSSRLQSLVEHRPGGLMRQPGSSEPCASSPSSLGRKEQGRQRKASNVNPKSLHIRLWCLKERKTCNRNTTYKVMSYSCLLSKFAENMLRMRSVYLSPSIRNLSTFYFFLFKAHRCSKNWKSNYWIMLTYQAPQTTNGTHYQVLGRNIY